MRRGLTQGIRYHFGRYMQFNSAEFLLFLPLVVGAYYLFPTRFRWILLLLASYLFYMWWKPVFAVLVAISTVLDWGLALLMEKSNHPNRKLALVSLSLFANLGMLFSFKYADFFIDTINFMGGTDLGHLGWILPVGISFYTFQTLSYTLDVYAGNVKAERHLGHFALFVIYFPQLVAGPIERYSDLAPQLRVNQVLTYRNLSHGFRLVLFGLFVKMVLADRLAPHVDAVYADPSAYNGWSLALACFLYSFQIYGDFMGYSLVAMGSAKCMGVDLMENFKQPYLSRSIAEFWQRWHISLGKWFRDYVFLPLGGSRVAFSRLAVNILMVFVLSGFWHGANWTFLAWGLGWGLLYILEKAIGSWGPSIPMISGSRSLNGIRILVVFAITTLMWIPFRSMNWSNLKLMVGGLASFPSDCLNLEVEWIAWLALAVVLIADWQLQGRRIDVWMDAWSAPFRWLVYAALTYGIVVFSSQEDVAFIYFQF